jgi:hypothetical protein
MPSSRASNVGSVASSVASRASRAGGRIARRAVDVFETNIKEAMNTGGSVRGGDDDYDEDYAGGTDLVESTAPNAFFAFLSKYKIIIIVIVIGIIILVVFLVYPQISGKASSGFTAMFKKESEEEKTTRETNESLIKQINTSTEVK